MMLFYSTWCTFCTSFLPIFAKTAAGNPAAFAKVSIDDLPGLEDSFDIEVVPTVLFFRAGGLKNRLDGVLGRGLDEEDLRAFVKSCGFGKKRP